MKKIKYILFSALLVLVNIIFSLDVLGATKYTVNISAPSTATKGSNITLSFNAGSISSLKNGYSAYSGAITYDSTKLEFVSATSSISGWLVDTAKGTDKINFVGYDNMPPSNTKYQDTEIFKVVFKVISVTNGNTTVTATNIKGSTSVGESLAADPTSKTITIGDATPPATKSNDATLSNLNAGGYTLSPAFNKDQTSYKVSVPNDVTSLNVTATPNDSKATVSVSGNGNLSVGKNNIIVEVKAEDGTKKTYTIEVTRADKSNDTPSTPNTPSTPSTPNTPSTPSTPSTSKKSSNANLKNITGIEGLDFNKDVTTYDMEVPFETTSLNIGATPEDSKAKVTISNPNLKNLEVGKNNTITILVTAEDSTVKVYTVNVRRSPYKSETDLKELVVNDKDVLEEGKDEFKVTVPSDTTELDISAIPKSDNSTVKIKGDTTLKDGHNKVIIEVTDKNGFSKSYTIDVEKESDNFLLKFLKDYWWLLLLMLFILLILLLLLYLHRKNEKLLDEIQEDELKYINMKKDNTNNKIIVEHVVADIDNDDDLSYNSSNNNMVANTYVPKHSDEDDILKNILDDDSVEEVQREITIIKNDSDGDDDLEKEYKITQKYRKK